MGGGFEDLFNLEFSPIGRLLKKLKFVLGGKMDRKIESMSESMSDK
jgi:hypothetical protein